MDLVVRQECKAVTALALHLMELVVQEVEEAQTLEQIHLLVFHLITLMLLVEQMKIQQVLVGPGTEQSLRHQKHQQHN